MAVFTFGEFELDVERRALSRNDAPVKIGARAFDILTCLVAKAGEIVAKDELLKAVWPTTHVDEVALRVHMVALRKAMSSSPSGPFIESVAGRGYQFIKAVARVGDPAAVPYPARVPASALPAAFERLIGREDFVREAVTLFLSVDLVTIVGPGGIGKTSVAVEIARRIEGKFDKTIFLDLATLASGSMIAAHLASRLGLSVYSADPVPGVVQALAGTATLLIFDNCEHLIDDCAVLVERLQGAVRNLKVIATSREALRIRAENVRLLQGLSAPDVGDQFTDPASYSAVELFLERLQSATGFVPASSREELDVITRIAVRLDGIPLAIELAAARAGSLGVKTVLESLNDPIGLLKRGRRTAPARQQTLRATLEWSFSLLSETERKLLKRLSVFAGSFTAKAAGVVASNWLESHEFDDTLAGLTAKSLISISRHDRSLRLLEVTRAFAAEELGAGEESVAARNAHATWVYSRLSAAIYDWTVLDTPSWLASYGALINDVRLALSWTFADRQNEFALKLAASSHILWTQLGLMNEQLQVLERAVGLMEGPAAPEPIAETQLRASYASVLFHLKSLSADEEALRQFRKATLTAETTGDPTEILRTHSGICAILTTHGRYQEAMDIAGLLESKFGAVANNAVSRIIAMNAHYLGEFDRSNNMCLRALDGGSGNVRSTRTSGAGYDQKLLAMLVMAKNAWIEGSTEVALSHSRNVVAEALNIGDPISSCLVLAVSSCVVYLGMGDWKAARHHLDLLHEVATRHSLVRWKEWADGYELVMPGSGATQSDFERSFVDSTAGPRVEGIVVAAGVHVGMPTVEFALSSGAGWCRPELLRVKGELLKYRDPDQARDLFEQAYEMAGRQGARLWELRAAASLMSSASARNKEASLESVARVLRLYPGQLAPAEKQLLIDSGYHSPNDPRERSDRILQDLVH